MSTPNPISLEARRLSKRFGDRAALCEIELAIRCGECVALTGRNGAGKTTLLRCLAAASRPTSGDVRWFGKAAGVRAGQRRLIGLVSDETRLYAHLTARENLLFAARMLSVKRARNRVDEVLERADLQGWADQPVQLVSRGMQQRLAVLRALIHDPPIWLLDEPFSGLDDFGGEWLIEFISAALARGQTVCLATHDDRKTRRLADRTLNLQHGRLSRQFRLTIDRKDPVQDAA